MQRIVALTNNGVSWDFFKRDGEASPIQVELRCIIVKGCSSALPIVQGSFYMSVPVKFQLNGHILSKKAVKRAFRHLEVTSIGSFASLD